MNTTDRTKGNEMAKDQDPLPSQHQVQRMTLGEYETLRDAQRILEWLSLRPSSREDRESAVTASLAIVGMLER